MKNFSKQMGILVIILGLVAGTAYGANKEELSSITPDNPRYVEKIIEEAIDAALAADPEEKAAIFIEMANERMRELEMMVALGKTEYAEGLIRSYVRIIERAMSQILKRIRERGGDEEKVLERVREATEKHIRVLTRLLERVPEQARSTIQRVIARCTEQRNRVTSRLEELKVPGKVRGPAGSGTKGNGNGKGNG